MNLQDLQYTELPARTHGGVGGFLAPDDAFEKEVARFAAFVKPRPANQDGDIEVEYGVELTHRFVQAPGDSEMLTWHYVEAGKGEPVVFLHGIPDSWYQWKHQLATLAQTHHVIAVDLKGYGQSDKRYGDYRHEGVSEQLLALLDVIGLDKFNLVTHDRGTVQADYLIANHPDRVLRYGRGEQHLYHFNEALAPQGTIFADSDLLLDPVRMTLSGYHSLVSTPLLDEVIERTIQEFSYPGVGLAVRRYFNSSSFRKEWIDRRTRLLAAWTCPIMIIQGYNSLTQPREFYEHAPDYIPHAKEVRVRYIMDSGHFWTLEQPEQTTRFVQELLTM